VSTGPGPLRRNRLYEQVVRQVVGWAAEAELAAADPLSDNAFKIPMVTNMITRTLLQISAEARA